MAIEKESPAGTPRYIKLVETDIQGAAHDGDGTGLPEQLPPPTANPNPEGDRWPTTPTSDPVHKGDGWDTDPTSNPNTETDIRLRN
ncbi:MAG: hypothetical protein ACREHC_05165 [Candidatus Levyibacteriota bacterium]